MKKHLLPITFAVLATAAQAQDWSLTGNAGTNASTNFLGTTDNVSLVFRRNNVQAGLIDRYDNTFFGNSAGLHVAPTLQAHLGLFNTGFGSAALLDLGVGTYNSAVGMDALANCVAGDMNSSFGAEALATLTNSDHNCAFGFMALTNTTGNSNTAIGSLALERNVAGSGATAVGAYAMGNANNTATAYSNECVAVGWSALKGSTSPADNTGNSNTAVGYEALTENSSGSSNVALGTIALMNNTIGGYNCATGRYALVANTSGSYNAANGYASLTSNSTGSSNVALGVLTLSVNTTGSNNTGLGRGANVASGNLSNATALGYNASVSTSNKVRLGNSSVTVVEGQVGYTTPSDARFKREVRADVKGLDFILELRPVSYTFDRAAFAKHIGEDTKDREAELTALSQKRTVGFLAQEVEKTVRVSGFADFDAVHAPENEQDNYGLAYAEFVVPLVKAVQELHAENEELREELERLREEFHNTGEKKNDDRHGQGTGILHVYPDPAVDLLRIEVPAEMIGKDGVLELLDSSGRRVLSQRSTGIPATLQLDLPSGLVIGTYTVSLRTEGAPARIARVIIGK